ncbi:hypothetical protein GUJ93_ZPchr0001g32967 [Zizania palustris]|uniref:dCMP deaminase n=1 Tax=Zizania palustris TaxID=103762 RepID=A0A8J5RUZ5_ZIZPA|nr:hypothetical protein GUJ93_ZPchr0001g32967 [Zizania palustris]
MASTRDLAVASISAAVGAVAAAAALRLLSSYGASPAKRQRPPTPRAEPLAVNGSTAERPPAQSPFDPTKREGYILWDDYFMAIAFLSAERSKDPNRQSLATRVEAAAVVLGGASLSASREVRRELAAARRGIGQRRWPDTTGACRRRWQPKGRLSGNITQDLGAVPFDWESAVGRSSRAGIGYNGFPRGCSDNKLPWAKKSARGDPLETKYPYVVHAEVNAILNTNHASAAGQKLYVTMFPCNECAKIIIQSGVSEVIYFIEKRIDNSDYVYVASHKLLSMAGVKVRKHQPQMSQIPINSDAALAPIRTAILGDPALLHSTTVVSAFFLACGRLRHGATSTPRSPLSLFACHPRPHVFVFNSLVRSLHPSPACSPLPLFRQFLRLGVRPNRFTFPLLITSVSSLRELRTVHWWNRGRTFHALATFRRMLAASVAPNGVGMVAALGACAAHCAVDTGIWIHEYVQKQGREMDGWMYWAQRW